MQFLGFGYDGTDAAAPKRRLDARPAHNELLKKLKDEGRHQCAAALLDEKEQMVGSVIITDFPDREALNAWLEKEPYVVQKVWEKVEVKTCRISPVFFSTTL